MTGDYKLSGKILKSGKLVSENYFNFFVADPQFTTGSIATMPNLSVYDRSGKTSDALRKLNVPFKALSSLQNIPMTGTLMIGENSADNALTQNAGPVKEFVSKGGRLLCLRQDSAHLSNLNAVLDAKITNKTIDIDNPVYPVSDIYPRNGYYVDPERQDHLVFAGITREHLKVWSDYTNWDEKQKGFPAIYPVTDGFTLQINMMWLG